MLENKMKLLLINHEWVCLSLNNEFNPQIEWELEDETSQEWRLKCVNKCSKYWSRWQIEYASSTKEVFKHESKLNNIRYLIVRFE